MSRSAERHSSDTLTMCPDATRVATCGVHVPQLVRLAGTLLSPGAHRGRLAILIYHRVLESPDPLLPEEVDRAGFEWQIELLSRCFNVLPLPEAIDRLARDSLPPRAACVTFDDGYLDNHDVALPILRKWGVPATFFVATDYLDGQSMWNDLVIEIARRVSGPVLDLSRFGLGIFPVTGELDRNRVANTLVRAHKYLDPAVRAASITTLLDFTGVRAPRGLMMRPEQVLSLYAGGMEIGAHTVRHPILARLDRGAARAEINESKSRLEEILGGPVRLFAYPNGVPNVDYTAEHVRMVRDSGFEAAVSTAPGVATRVTSPYQLPRFTPWDKRPMRFAARLLANYMRTSTSAV